MPVPKRAFWLIVQILNSSMKPVWPLRVLGPLHHTQVKQTVVQQWCSSYTIPLLLLLLLFKGDVDFYILLLWVLMFLKKLFYLSTCMLSFSFIQFPFIFAFLYLYRLYPKLPTIELIVKSSGMRTFLNFYNAKASRQHAFRLILKVFLARELALLIYVHKRINCIEAGDCSGIKPGWKRNALAINLVGYQKLNSLISHNSNSLISCHRLQACFTEMHFHGSFSTL